MLGSLFCKACGGILVNAANHAAANVGWGKGDKEEVRRGEEDNEEEKCESNEEDNEKEEAPGRWTFAKQLGGHRLFLKRVEGTVNRARVVPGPRREKCFFFLSSFVSHCVRWPRHFFQEVILHNQSKPTSNFNRKLSPV